jgi:signal-transduction protein with cAMP-binding, CBS, and nucleotidyltransferase domain
MIKSILEFAEYISNKYNVKLTAEESEQIASIIEYRKLKKGELFLPKGQKARHIIFVYSGIIRQFYYKRGRDITEHFTCADNHFTYCIISLFQDRPTNLMIEALEESIIFTIHFKRLKDLALQCTKIARLYTNILEEGLCISQQKADSWRFETARERYDRFKKEYPEVVKKASVNHIASYLLMTPESLSRVRAGIL